MQLSLTNIIATLSAVALSLPTDGPMPTAYTPNVRNGLPYSNFDLYNHSQPYNASAPDSRATNSSDPHYYLDQVSHHNTSSNTTTLTPRAAKRHTSAGDIASYSDGYCTVTAAPKVYLAESACVKFAPLSGTNIGIDWGGSALVKMLYVQTYTDDECKTYGPLIKTPGSLNMDQKGAGSCTPYSEFLKKGGEWMSVLMSE